MPGNEEAFRRSNRLSFDHDIVEEGYRLGKEKRARPVYSYKSKKDGPITS